MGLGTRNQRKDVSARLLPAAEAAICLANRLLSETGCVQRGSDCRRGWGGGEGGKCPVPETEHLRLVILEPSKGPFLGGE